MDPARIFTESLTPHPELENSQGQKLTKSTVIRARMPVKRRRCRRLAHRDRPPFSGRSSANGALRTWLDLLLVRASRECRVDPGSCTPSPSQIRT